MTAPGHAPTHTRPLRSAIGTALVLGGLFAGAPSRGASEDPTPDRAATADEVLALADKVASLTAFRAVFDFKSKTNSGVLTLNYREPDEGHLSMRVTPKEGDEVGEMDCWLVDGQLTFRLHMQEQNVHGSASFREPFALAEHTRAALSERLGVMKREKGLVSTASFSLNFAKDPKDSDRVWTTAQLMYDVGTDPTRVRWFLDKKDWEPARRVGDRIVVEQDDCVYRFSMATGFLTDATVADRGTATLRELHMEVAADEFVPAERDPNAENVSPDTKRTAWKIGLDTGRRYAFHCLTELDEADKLDDARLDTWKSVVAEHFESWFPPSFEQFTAAKSATVDKYVEWYSHTREAANGDAAALESLADDTKRGRDRMEAEGLDYVDRFAQSLEVPTDVKIASALGERGLDAEREAVRAAGRKALVEPLLKRLDDGVAAAGESK